MKSAITNQLTVKDLTVTIDPATGSNTSVNSCANVRTAIDALTTVVTSVLSDGSTNNLAAEVVGTVPSGEAKCKRDIGYIVDSVSQDLFWGGNEFIIGATREYFDLSGTPISNGLINEENTNCNSI